MPIKTAWTRALLGLAAAWLVGLALIPGAEAGPLSAMPTPVRAIFLPALRRNHAPVDASPTPTPTFSAPPTATFSPTPSATPTHTPTSTPIPTPTGTQAPTVMIYGWVTLAGEPIADVTIELGLYETDLYVGAMDEASTDEEGLYSFWVDAGLLDPGQNYGVRYENAADTEGRLLYWHGYPFAPDAGDTTYPGGDFDIADIVLVTPDTSEPLPLPIIFAWLPRDLAWAPDDIYQLRIAWRVGEETIAAFTSDDLLDGQYTLAALPEGFEYNRPFEWWASVWGAYGYGRSRQSNWVAFAAP